MDGDYITAFRTGATAALYIETLAIKNYKTIGLVFISFMVSTEKLEFQKKIMLEKKFFGKPLINLTV